MKLSTEQQSRTATIKGSRFPESDPDAGEPREGSRRESRDGTDGSEVFGDGDAGEGDGAEEKFAGFVVDADLESSGFGVATPVEVSDEGAEPVDATAEGDDRGLFEEKC